LEILIPALLRVEALRSLTLNGNQFIQSCGMPLSPLLTSSSLKHLTFLECSHNQLRDDGIRHLAGALAENVTLRVLKLHYNKVGEEGARLLAVSLRLNSSLTSLILHHNEIQVRGAGHLAQTLKMNSTLRKLKLGNNGILNAGAVAFAKAIKMNYGLHTLDLSYNKIDVEGVSALMMAHQKNINLTRLKIEFNHPGTTHFEHFIKMQNNKLSKTRFYSLLLTTSFRNTNRWKDKKIVVLEMLRATRILLLGTLGSPLPPECLTHVIECMNRDDEGTVLVYPHESYRVLDYGANRTTLKLGRTLDDFLLHVFHTKRPFFWYGVTGTTTKRRQRKLK